MHDGVCWIRQSRLQCLDRSVPTVVGVDAQPSVFKQVSGVMTILRQTTRILSVQSVLCIGTNRNEEDIQALMAEESNHTT